MPKLNAYAVYLIINFASSVFFGMIATMNLVCQHDGVGIILSPALRPRLRPTPEQAGRAIIRAWPALTSRSK